MSRLDRIVCIDGCPFAMKQHCLLAQRIRDAAVAGGGEQAGNREFVQIANLTDAEALSLCEKQSTNPARRTSPTGQRRTGLGSKRKH